MKYLLIPTWKYFLRPLLWLPIRTIIDVLFVLLFWLKVSCVNSGIFIWHFSSDNFESFNDYEVDSDSYFEKHYYKTALDYILKRNLIKEKISDEEDAG